jgi:hypothetical protein
MSEILCVITFDTIHVSSFEKECAHCNMHLPWNQKCCLICVWYWKHLDKVFKVSHNCNNLVREGDKLNLPSIFNYI